MTKDQLRLELIRILDQNTAAVQRVVDSYLAKRTPERDVYWLAIQTGKEFGAISLQYQRAADALRFRNAAAEVPRLVHAIREEIDHYEGYLKILRATARGDVPVENMYAYVLMRVENGRIDMDPAMKACRSLWPDNYRYFERTLEVFAELSPWGARAVASQFEGGAVSWHWAMSELPHRDSFLRSVSELEKTIVADELHHGPEEIQEVVATFDERGAAEVERVFAAIRELRYLEVRQRNEQFLHPMSEAEVQEIGAALTSGSIEPVPLFSRSLAAAAH